jgi:hypothetical protein
MELKVSAYTCFGILRYMYIVYQIELYKEESTWCFSCMNRLVVVLLSPGQVKVPFFLKLVLYLHLD